MDYEATYARPIRQVVPGGNYTEAQIKAIAESIITFTNEKNEQEFDIGKILVDLYPGLEYTEIDGSYFFYDSTDNKIRLDPGNAIPPTNQPVDDADDENNDDGNQGGADNAAYGEDQGARQRDQAAGAGREAADPNNLSADDDEEHKIIKLL